MRKPFLDNLRYSIVLLVLVYHVFYLFNSVGVITNVVIPGIPALDSFLYLVNPWFMITMFAISGICARYSLEKQTGRAFLRSKIRRQLIPSIVFVFLFGWSCGWVTNQYVDMFAGAQLPGVIKYLIWSLSGLGPVWFLHQLLLADLVLLLIRRLDKKQVLLTLGSKVTMPVLILLVFALWGSAQILNAPIIEVYRCGIYTFSFLAGYYIFSHDHVQNLLARWAKPLLAASAVLAIGYIFWAWGENYGATSHLKKLPVNLYAWFGMLTVLGCAKRWMDTETAFTRYMAPRSFGIFILHYPLLALGAWAMDKMLGLPVWTMYLLLPLLSALVLPLLIAGIRRIPILNRLILGG